MTKPPQPKVFHLNVDLDGFREDPGPTIELIIGELAPILRKYQLARVKTDKGYHLEAKRYILGIQLIVVPRSRT